MTNDTVARHFRWGAWLLLTAVFIFEGELVKLLFRQVGPRLLVGKEVTNWATILLYTPRMFIVFFLALIITGLVVTSDLKRDMKSGLSAPVNPARVSLLILGNLTFFALFYGLTVHLSATASPINARVWIAAGALSRVTATLLLVLAFLPGGMLADLMRRHWRKFLVAAIVGSVAWLSGLYIETLWRPLARSTFLLSYSILRLFTADTVCMPDKLVFGTSSFNVFIGGPCSGIEGIGLVCVFLGVYLWAFRTRLQFPWALSLIPLGILAAWIANAVRISALILVGTWISPSIALGGFHSKAGSLLFCVVALGLVAVSSRPPFSTPAVKDHEGPRGVNLTAVYLVPLLSLLATALLTGLFTSGFDWFYPIRVLVVAAVLWFCRREYADLKPAASWEAVLIGIATFVVWMALEPKLHDSTTQRTFELGLHGMPALAGWTWLSFRMIGSVVTVPLAEEIAFRGYLTRRLIASEFQEVPSGQFSWLSFIVSSILFGALHQRWLAGTLAGMLFALALYRRRKLSDAVLAHAVTNALLSGYVLFTGRWALWT